VSTGRRTGVLVMAYGSPADLGEVEAYYTHIRRGRPPEPAQLADLIARYEAIGGVSPLRERTEAQVERIRTALEAVEPDRFAVGIGSKHTAPFIEDGVAELVGRGVREIVGVVLAPHYSRTSVGEYLRRASEAASAHGATVWGIEHWYDLPAYAEFLAGAVRDAAATLPAAHKVLFTAHSLPQRVLEGDPYAGQLHAGAAAVAALVGLGRFADWGLGWQSAGRTPEPWIGPDVLDLIRSLGETGRADGVLVCPHGFVSDHLEVRYDLDIEAAGVAREVGLAFARTRVVDDDPVVLGALATRIRATADAAERTERTDGTGS
jgi:ferrochelatase